MIQISAENPYFRSALTLAVLMKPEAPVLDTSLMPPNSFLQYADVGHAELLAVHDAGQSLMDYECVIMASAGRSP